jgi:hypothetical protein
MKWLRMLPSLDEQNIGWLVWNGNCFKSYVLVIQTWNRIVSKEFGVNGSHVQY